MNKRTITYFFLIVLSINTYSQSVNNENSMFWENVSFGGGLGLSFGNGFFSGTIAPSAIYNFNEKFSTGLGLNATYAKQKNVHTSTILGGSIIGFYNPIPQLQISAEFEELNVSRKFEFIGSNITDNYWYPALSLGAGYRKANVTFGIKYDVLYDSQKSIYADAYIPFVRFYF